MTISKLELIPNPQGRPATRISPGVPVGAPAGDETPEAAFERIRRRLMRLAFDIHDGPLQSLAAAGFGLNDLEERLSALVSADGAAASARGIVADILAELSEAERTLRTLVSMLEDGRPEIALASDILREELRRFHRRSRARVDVRGDWHYHPDSRSQALTLEALVRESLTNVAKHANADHVVIRLETSTTEVLLEIEDDGRGFDPSAASSTIGLIGMRERVKLLGGELEILSQIGGPTLITAIIRRWQQRPRAEAYTAPPIAERVGLSA